MQTKSIWSNLTIILGASLCLYACGGGGGGSAPASTSVSTTPTTQTTTSNVATPQPPPVVAGTTTQVKLLALYTDGVAAQFNSPDLRIAHLVNVANDVMSTSGVDIHFSLEHIEWVDYSDTIPITQALDDLTPTNSNAGASGLAGVAALRNQVEADLVVLFRPYANDGHCGYAWIGGFGTQGDFSNPAEDDYGYSVVSSNCSDYTLVHELGHNLGLAHSRRESTEGGTFGYAVGYGMDREFVTIMASPTEFDAAQLPKLSSPSLICNTFPCGVDHTDSVAGSDAVRALNFSKDAVAAYR